MTITPDETPRLATAAERKVYQSLLAQLQPNDRVIPGQRVTDHLKDHEVDFVVAIEGAGIVCIEVKGGEVWHDGETWWQTAARPRAQDQTGPPGPRSLLRAARLHRKGRPLDAGPAALGSRNRPARTPRLPTTSHLPECPRWKVIDRNDLADARRQAPDTCSYGRNSNGRCSPSEGIEQLSTALSGRGLPQRSVVARALANEDAADALTEHQAVILDAIQLLNRVEIRGGAGSGKTFLAMEQAADSPRRVSASPWSATPTVWPPTWNASAANWPRRQQPAYVGEFHDLGKLWGARRRSRRIDRQRRDCHSSGNTNSRSK